MRNLLLLLVLANVLYFMWGKFVGSSEQDGIAVVNESDLGPPLELSKAAVAEAAASVGAVLGSGKPSDLAAIVGRSCVTIGPFTENTDANGARDEYKADGMQARVRTTQGQVFVGHWVQIKNIPDRATGDRMLETLKNGGLGESYLVPTDDEGLKISLGLFGEMSRAEKVELQAKSLGLPVDVAPRMRDSTVFFVDIGLPPGKGAGAMIEEYGAGRVALRDKATCPKSN